MQLRYVQAQPPLGAGGGGGEEQISDLVLMYILKQVLINVYVVDSANSVEIGRFCKNRGKDKAKYIVRQNGRSKFSLICQNPV